MMPPARILAQQHHKKGERRKKRPVITWAKPRPMLTQVEQRYQRHIQPWVNHAGQRIDFGDHSSIRVKATPKNDLGNLIWQDYRFYIGAKEPSAQYSRCRACRAVLIGLGERKAHAEKFKCTLWLVESYKVLNQVPNAVVKLNQLTRRECVCCSVETNQSLWGVPICTTGRKCIDLWMFDDEMPPANLTAALVEVSEILANTFESARKVYEQNIGK